VSEPVEARSVEEQLVLALDELADVRAALTQAGAETVAARGEVANLRSALETSRCIGMAMGILMVRRGLDEEQAFHVLTTVSQHRNRKLRDIAYDVVLTGELPH